MSAGTAGLLGIKTADGRIAEVLDFGRPDSRTTVFTTVADRQRRARFEFYYRAPGGTGWIYLDALSLDRIQAAPAGEPDLEVKVRCDREGNLLLGMGGSGSARPSSFVVDAATIRRLCGRLTEGRAAVRRPPATSEALESGGKRRRAPAGLAFLILIPLLLAGVLFARFLWFDPGSRREESSGNSGSVRKEREPSSEYRDAVDTRQPMPVGAAPAAPDANVLKPSGGTPVSPAETAATAGGVESPPVPEASPEPQGAVQGAAPWAESPAQHEIVWGDTLWRITERYYGNRDLYPELAESNDLLDPDLIIAGESLQLPPAIEGRQRKSLNGEQHE